MSAAAETRRRDVKAGTPTILQMEAVECGAACLAMVLAHFGRWVPLEELRGACDVSRDGTNAKNVVLAARSYGLEAKGWRKEPEELRALRPPFIVFWNFNHFVVVDGFKGGDVLLNDPAVGPRAVSASEFDEAFTGIVLTFAPGPSFKKAGQKPSLWPALKARARGSESGIAFILLAGLLLVIPGLIIPTFARIFVDDYLVRGMKDWLKPLLIAMALTVAARAALVWLQQFCLLRLQTKLSVAGAGRFFWHVLRLPVDFYTQRYSGEVAGRVAVNQKVAGLIAGPLALAGVDLLLVVFYAGLMLSIDVPLTLVGFAAVAANIGVGRLIRRKRVDAGRRLSRESGKLMGVSMGGLQAVESLKATGSESDFFATWAGHQAKLTTYQQELQSVAATWLQLPNFLQALTTAGILGFGGWRVMDGHLTLGMLVAFQALMAAFSDPVWRSMKLIEKLQELEGDMARLDDVLAYRLDPVFTDPPKPPAGKILEKLSGRVELRGVTFGYSRRRPPLIEDFSLTLRPGARVALVGPSGCGKSTTSKLVTGLYEPWAGEILFDGVPRKDIPRDVLAASVALVDQDIVLFEGPVRDNLTLWDASIPDSDVVRAGRDARIHDDILSRPNGYDGLLEEGGRNLSGGQRQRLELARALSGNPSVLVLDEATSALDPLTERLIDQNLRRRGCSCLIIAHRLSTIRDADEIIVLDEGKVVQRGTHDRLMKDADGLYARLARG
ncbi:MAG TPA: NHLP family bacteriocin export ABC transporter peptidase/permease/ATPase subunit [Elusimicrobiota bacterium]|nr:NHLP family bacteriocin export ABC transporter peptidase/permease/ATPase subunit [Elusimicrobiota bacterium]